MASRFARGFYEKNLTFWDVFPGDHGGRGLRRRPGPCRTARGEPKRRRIEQCGNPHAEGGGVLAGRGRHQAAFYTYGCKRAFSSDGGAARIGRIARRNGGYVVRLATQCARAHGSRGECNAALDPCTGEVNSIAPNKKR